MARWPTRHYLLDASKAPFAVCLALATSYIVSKALTFASELRAVAVTLKSRPVNHSDSSDTSVARFPPLTAVLPGFSTLLAPGIALIVGYALGLASRSRPCLPAAHHVTLHSRLHAALELLRDLLPGHVVEELLSDTQNAQEQQQQSQPYRRLASQEQQLEPHQQQPLPSQLLQMQPPQSFMDGFSFRAASSDGGAACGSVGYRTDSGFLAPPSPLPHDSPFAEPGAPGASSSGFWYLPSSAGGEGDFGGHGGASVASTVGSCLSHLTAGGVSERSAWSEHSQALSPTVHDRRMSYCSGTSCTAVSQRSAPPWPSTEADASASSSSAQRGSISASCLVPAGRPPLPHATAAAASTADRYNQVDALQSPVGGGGGGGGGGMAGSGGGGSSVDEVHAWLTGAGGRANLGRAVMGRQDSGWTGRQGKAVAADCGPAQPPAAVTDPVPAPVAATVAPTATLESDGSSSSGGGSGSDRGGGGGGGGIDGGRGKRCCCSDGSLHSDLSPVQTAAVDGGGSGCRLASGPAPATEDQFARAAPVPLPQPSVPLAPDHATTATAGIEGLPPETACAGQGQLPSSPPPQQQQAIPQQQQQEEGEKDEEENVFTRRVPLARHEQLSDNGGTTGGCAAAARIDVKAPGFTASLKEAAAPAAPCCACDDCSAASGLLSGLASVGGAGSSMVVLVSDTDTPLDLERARDEIAPDMVPDILPDPYGDEATLHVALEVVSESVAAPETEAAPEQGGHQGWGWHLQQDASVVNPAAATGDQASAAGSMAAAGAVANGESQEGQELGHPVVGLEAQVAARSPVTAAVVTAVLNPPRDGASSLDWSWLRPHTTGSSAGLRTQGVARKLGTVDVINLPSLEQWSLQLQQQQQPPRLLQPPLEASSSTTPSTWDAVMVSSAGSANNKQLDATEAEAEAAGASPAAQSPVLGCHLRPGTTDCGTTKSGCTGREPRSAGAGMGSDDGLAPPHCVMPPTFTGMLSLPPSAVIGEVHGGSRGGVTSSSTIRSCYSCYSAEEDNTADNCNAAAASATAATAAAAAHKSDAPVTAASNLDAEDMGSRLWKLPPDVITAAATRRPTVASTTATAAASITSKIAAAAAAASVDDATTAAGPRFSMCGSVHRTSNRSTASETTATMSQAATAACSDYLWGTQSPMAGAEEPLAPAHQQRRSSSSAAPGSTSSVAATQQAATCGPAGADGASSGGEVQQPMGASAEGDSSSAERNFGSRLRRVKTSIAELFTLGASGGATGGDGNCDGDGGDRCSGGGGVAGSDTRPRDSPLWQPAAAAAAAAANNGGITPQAADDPIRGGSRPKGSGRSGRRPVSRTMSSAAAFFRAASSAAGGIVGSILLYGGPPPQPPPALSKEPRPPPQPPLPADQAPSPRVSWSQLPPHSWGFNTSSWGSCDEGSCATVTGPVLSLRASLQRPAHHLQPSGIPTATLVAATASAADAYSLYDTAAHPHTHHHLQRQAPHQTTAPAPSLFRGRGGSAGGAAMPPSSSAQWARAGAAAPPPCSPRASSPAPSPASSPIPSAPSLFHPSPSQRETSLLSTTSFPPQLSYQHQHPQHHNHPQHHHHQHHNHFHQYHHQGQPVMRHSLSNGQYGRSFWRNSLNALDGVLEPPDAAALLQPSALLLMRKMASDASSLAASSAPAAGAAPGGGGGGGGGNGCGGNSGQLTVLGDVHAPVFRSRRLHRASTGVASCNSGGGGGGSDAGCGGGGSGTGSYNGGGGGGWIGGGASGYSLGRDLPYAEWHPCVSVLFADICGFTQISNRVPAVAVMEMLNALYCRLDALCASWQHPNPHRQAAAAAGGGPTHGSSGSSPPVYKVQIIGDAYMVATGLLADDPAHAATACLFALACLREAAQVLDPCDGRPLRLRIGVHSGPIVSGVVGRMRRQYSVFGDTVNVASRMESTGAPGAIHVSEETQRLAAPYMPPYSVVWRRREAVEVKGKGLMDTYWMEPNVPPPSPYRGLPPPPPPVVRTRSYGDTARSQHVPSLSPLAAAASCLPPPPPPQASVGLDVAAAAADAPWRSASLPAPLPVPLQLVSEHHDGGGGAAAAAATEPFDGLVLPSPVASPFVTAAATATAVTMDGGGAGIPVPDS